MIVNELFDNSVAANLKNYFAGRRDLMMRNFGSQQANRRLNTRLIANKMIDDWNDYVWSHSLQPTNEELARYIADYYSPEELQLLARKFPSLAAAGTNLGLVARAQSQLQAEPTMPLPAGQPQPQQPPPQQQSTQQQSAQSDHALYTRMLAYRRRINQQFATAQPDATEVMSNILRMVQHIATKGPKPRWWVKSYIDQLKANTVVMQQVPQIGQIDDSWFT